MLLRMHPPRWRTFSSELAARMELATVRVLDAVWLTPDAHATILGGAALRSWGGDESCLNQCRISEELRIASLCARPVPLASRSITEAKPRAHRAHGATGSER